MYDTSLLFNKYTNNAEAKIAFIPHNINVKTILEYISQNFDFVLTISHLTEIKQHCDHQILLKKDDSNYSCVNYN